MKLKYAKYPKYQFPKIFYILLRNVIYIKGFIKNKKMNNPVSITQEQY